MGIATRALPPRPPLFNANVTMSRSFQFRSVQTTPWKQVLKVSDFCTILSAPIATGTAGANNLQFQPLAACVRVKRIRMWQPFTSDASVNALLPSTCYIQWQSGTAESGVKKMAQAINATETGYLDTRPPSKSTASFWAFSSSSDTVCNLGGDGANTVVVDVEWTLGIGSGPVLPSTWTNGAISLVNGVFGGQLYYFPLDLNGYLGGHGPFLLPIGADEVVI